ncbi:MAG: UDP-3-O-(3-hydroxymyristoyl)glucosamine N-acyltransferase [Alphaproteobacteria bacterium]|nr:UDP-3-O-(3-hydroxymyristoyl)glucosamine N-acyltransferase [Alphaproteobacteria bacterium]
MADERFYQNTGPYTIQDLAALCGASLGPNVDPNQVITDVSPLHKANAGHISCLHNPKYIDQFKQTKASACLVSPEFEKYAPKGLTLLVSSQPYRAYGQVAALFYPSIRKEGGISPQASVHSTAKIGKNCYIGPFAVIQANVIVGEGCEIGSNTVIDTGCELGKECTIAPNVTISHAILGKRVVVKPGARIGQRGFGFHMDEDGHLNIPQLGRVIIGDEVEIGSNTTIDRGAEADTIIGCGTRLDNLVQIAHNVEVGENCVMVAQSGIAGSSQLGRFVVVAGQVGIAGHLHVGDGAKIAAQSGVMRDIGKGEIVAGYPSVSVRDWHRQTIALKRLTEKGN